MANYSDDFNRPDSTNIGNWTEWNDDWSIISNQLAPGLTTTGVAVYASPLDTSDHYAEIVLSVATSTSMGVIGRSSVDTGTYYLWRTNGSSWNLFRQISGTFVDLGGYAAPVADGDIARIECIGSTIKGYVNGVERVSVTNTEITTGLYAGVRSVQSSTARFDNFATADTTLDSDIGAFFDFF